jgi:hypothetical protein
MNEQASASPFLTDSEEYLAQGDIFRLELVMPIPDTRKRIFRTFDGRHGALALTAGSGRVFSESDLLQTLEDLPPEERLPPLQRTPDGDPELVVVSADLFQHFIVVSQTCDISGQDSPARSACVVARVMTIAGCCRTENMPVSYRSPTTSEVCIEEKTMVELLAEKLGEQVKRESENDLTFPDYLRKILDEWKPKDLDAQIRNKVRNMLNNVVENRRLDIYYIRADTTRGMPDSFVEFSYLYTVNTDLLVEHKGSRIATLNSPYREEFAQRFAHYYMRIATPVPHRGEKF